MDLLNAGVNGEVREVLQQLELNRDNELVNFLLDNHTDNIHLLNFVSTNYPNGLSLKLQFNLCLIKDFLAGAVSNPSLDGLPAAFTPQFKTVNILTVANVVYSAKYYNNPKQFVGGLCQQKIIGTDTALRFATLYNRYSKKDIEGALSCTTQEMADEAGELSMSEAQRFLREAAQCMFEPRGSFHMFLRFSTRKEHHDLVSKVEALEKKHAASNVSWKKKWEPSSEEPTSKKTKWDTKQPVCFSHIAGGCTREKCTWEHTTFGEMGDGLKKVFIRFMRQNKKELTDELVKFESENCPVQLPV